LNTSSTFSTALLRGIYVALVSGAIAGLTLYQQTDDEKAAVITGILTALSALAMRGGLEGVVDNNRQKEGDVKTSDVQGIPPGQP
jgi:hypothetical protein